VLGKYLAMRRHSWLASSVRFAVVAGIALFAVAACGRTSTTITAKPTGGAGPIILTPRATSPRSSPEPTSAPATPSPRPTTSAPATPSPRPTTSASPAAAPVGADCGAVVPANGRGSLGSVRAERAITATSGNPRLSVFIAAVRSARLERTLNSRGPYTLVIPDNSAFAALTKAQILRLRNSGELEKIVKYHTAPAAIGPHQFATGATPKTLQGEPLRLSQTGSVYKVNGATVLCGNIRTSNATVYIVNKVLLPPR
jgi:uncharacterized surface protein with fasciclin (FAS1) repeats